MSCIHFKFKCDKKFDSVIFDGVSCNLTELKKLIIQKKGLSKHALDFDLLITNAQTKEVYVNNTDVIHKNSSVIVARVPVGGDHKPIDPSTEEPPVCLSELLSVSDSLITTTANDIGSNFTNCKDFWIKASTSGAVSCVETVNNVSQHVSRDFPFSSFHKTLPVNQVPHPSYVCHRCNRSGHFKHMCPLMLEGSDNDANLIKRATGIPRSELIPLRNHIPGAYITPEGTYAIPKKDAEAILKGKKEKPPFLQENEEKVSLLTMNVPPELTCSLCKDLFTDAVLTPCCNESFCDSCIRNRILESDESECPVCHQKDVSADQIHPNKFARDMVQSFLARSGYAAKRYGREMEEPDLDQVLTGVFTETKSEEQYDELRYLSVKDEPLEVDNLLENSSAKENKMNADMVLDSTDNIGEQFSTANSSSLQNEGPIKTIDSLSNPVNSFRNSQTNVMMSSAHRPVSITQLYKQSNNIQSAFSIPTHASAVYFSTPVVAATSQSIIASAMIPKPPLLTKDQFELIKRTLLGVPSRPHRDSRSRSPYKYSSRYYHRSKHRRHESKYSDFHSREHSESYASTKNKKVRSPYHSDNYVRCTNNSSESLQSDSSSSKSISTRISPLSNKGDSSLRSESKVNKVADVRRHRSKRKSVSSQEKKPLSASKVSRDHRRSVSVDSNSSVLKRKAKTPVELSSRSKKKQYGSDHNVKQAAAEKPSYNSIVSDKICKPEEQLMSSPKAERSESSLSHEEMNSSPSPASSCSFSQPAEAKDAEHKSKVDSVLVKSRSPSTESVDVFEHAKSSTPRETKFNFDGSIVTSDKITNTMPKLRCVESQTVETDIVFEINTEKNNFFSTCPELKDASVHAVSNAVIEESKPKLKDTYNLSPPSFYVPVSVEELGKSIEPNVKVRSTSPSESETDTSKDKCASFNLSSLFKAPASKWDRDSSSPSPIRESKKNESATVTNPLPRSIIETAEKVIFKPRLASLVAKKEKSPCFVKPACRGSPKKTRPSSKHRTDKSKRPERHRSKSRKSRERKRNHRRYEIHSTKKRRSKHKAEKYASSRRR